MFKSLRHSTSVLIIVAGFQLAFATAIILENTMSTATLSIGAVFLILSISAYRKAYSWAKISFTTFQLDWLPVLSTVLGATTTYLLSPVLTPVMSAAGVGLLASFIPATANAKYGDLNALQYPIYCGTFVGMSSSWVLPHLSWVIVASIVAGILFHAAKYVLVGVGGRLGSFAFVGVACSYFLHWVLEKTFL